RRISSMRARGIGGRALARHTLEAHRRGWLSVAQGVDEAFFRYPGSPVQTPQEPSSETPGDGGLGRRPVLLPQVEWATRGRRKAMMSHPLFPVTTESMSLSLMVSIPTPPLLVTVRFLPKSPR